MPIRKLNKGLGHINRKFPIWEFGADFYWHSSKYDRVQTPGGSGVWAYLYDDVADNAAYFEYDLGQQQFKLIPYATPKFPSDGFCRPDRTNLWDSNDLQDRGIQTWQAGLTHSHPAMSGNHILDINTLSWNQVLLVENQSGSASGLRFTRDEALSASFNRVFACLVKRPQGGVVNSGVCHLVGLPDGQLTAANLLSNTIYTQIRSDGWYLLSAVYPQMAGTGMFGVELQDGYSIYFEYPTLDGTNVDPQAGVFSAPDIGTADETGIHKMRIGHAAAGAPREIIPKAGWIGLTIVQMYNNQEVPLPFGLYANFAPNTNNFLRVQKSNSTQNTAVEVDTNAASQMFLNHSAPVPAITVGEKQGVVFTWGKRGNTKYGIYFMNGEIIEVVTDYTSMPSGVASFWDIGWDNTTDGREPAGCIQQFAMGRNLLTRQEGRMLSKWFQNQGLHGGD